MNTINLSYKDAVKYATGVFVLISLTVWILMYFGSSAFIPTGDRPKFEQSIDHWVPVVWGFATYFYIFILFVLNFEILKIKEAERKKLLFAVLGNIVTALIFNFIMSLFMRAAINVNNIPNEAHMGPLIKDFVLAAIIFFLSYIIYLSSQKQQIILEYEAMKAENARSRFEALKNQLDPHFLFNTFNTLDSLIEEDAQKARSYLQLLSSIFRYVIPNKELTTLEEELNFSYNYTELMQIRYENSLVVEYDIDKKYLTYEIVPLSIQILIENAIKHNVITLDEIFVIKVTVRPTPMVTVTNKIIPKKNTKYRWRCGLVESLGTFQIEVPERNRNFG